MSLARASTPALVGLAALSIVAFAVAERSLAPAHTDAYRMKLRAVQLMERSEKAIARAKQARGLPVDVKNDPEGTGLIGPQFTLTTTDRGSQTAKELAAHPNFAAAVTQMLLLGGVREGDLVAVGVTGSLPGLNLAVLSACKAIGAEPLVITSAGASMFGATDPEFTWLDMETAVDQPGLFSTHSIAASIGGGADQGRGLSPAGRQLIVDSIERNHVPLLDSPGVLEAVKSRVALYDSVAKVRGKAIRLYVNVGGGVASLGGAQNGRLIPAGLTRRLARRSYPNHGVIIVMADRGLPVIQLLNVERLAREFSIVDERGARAKPGQGLLFIKYRYNLWLVSGAALVILLANFFVLRTDLHHRLLGQDHPERNPIR
ncbi:MAG: poly-gamma-glutamate system protein [Candidatus Eisenbacteria bacterium]